MFRGYAVPRLRKKLLHIQMPKYIEKKLEMEARKKFHSITSPRARAYIYGTMHKIEAHKNPILVLKGNPAYINRMYSHLRAEHPSTRKRMFKLRRTLLS